MLVGRKQKYLAQPNENMLNEISENNNCHKKKHEKNKTINKIEKINGQVRNNCININNNNNNGSNTKKQQRTYLF